MKFPVCVALGWPKLVSFLCALFCLSTVNAVPIGELRKGIAVRDGAGGQGYILFVPGGLNPQGAPTIDVPGSGGPQGRFLVYSSNAKNFVAIQFVNGSWHYDDNSYLRPFVPQASDTIVASVNFTSDTVTMLNGQDTAIHGIRAGYQQGDVNITANVWDGVPNNGEFGVTGTFIDLNPLPVVPAAVNIPLSQKPWVIDNGSGIAYVEGENDEGTAYSFRFLSRQGINYAIQSSEDLQTWQNIGFYHGLGLTINHPLFPLIRNEGGEAVVEATPEEYTPPINTSLRITEIKSGNTTTGLHLSWLSMDDGTPMNYTLHGQTLETGFPTLYSKQFDEYVFFIQFALGGMDSVDVPTPDTLRTNDAAMIGKLLDSLPTINAEIAANTAAQSANPSPPPAAGVRKFYRIQRIHADSDGDNILDHIEVANGTDFLNFDSDGDGIADNIDSNPNENAAMVDPDGAGLSSSLLNGLVGRWDFEQANAQGNYPDKSPNSNDAQVVSGDYQKLGIISRAFSLIPNTATQTGNHLTMAAPSMGSVYSLSMWVKPEKYHLNGLNQQVLWSYQSDDNTRNMRLVLTTGSTLVLREKKQGQPVVNLASWSLGAPVNLGKWHHISLVRSVYSVPSISGYWHRLYFDGKIIPLANSTVPIESHTISAGTMAMGKDITSAPSAGETGEGDYFGLVDRLLFHNRALTATEILSIFRADSDRDGLWDVSESRSYIWRDSNGDGAEDNEEITYTINPFRWDRPDLDHDQDGILSLEEQNHATNPTDIAHPDSDGDLLPDGWELDNGLDPNDENDALLDGDNDGANNLVEYSFNSNPNDPDSDKDNSTDGAEIGGVDGNPDTPDGSNPNDPSDNGQPLPPEKKLAIRIGVGDVSGSKSEDYVMNIYRLNPDTGSEERFYTLRSGGHGQYKEITLDTFKKGDTYTFQIDWQSSNLDSSSSGSEGADYDYKFIVEPQNNEDGILLDQYDPRTKRVDTTESIRGEINDKEDYPQSVEPVRVANIVVDLDIVKPDDESKEIAENKEETEGEVVPLNADDDDDDGGAGGHGQNVIVADKDDVNGVEGEDDLIKIKLKKTAVANGKFRLVFDNTHIRLWQKPNKTKSVTSDKTEFPTNKETIVYVEGIKPNSDLSGTLISLKVKFGNGAFAVKDKVKIHVARPMFLIYGHESKGSANVDDHFASIAKDDRLEPYILKGKRNNKDVYYSLLYGGSEKELKIALSTQDAHVMFVGHSNFGLGPAFGEAGYTKLTDFMNVSGQGRASIDVDYFHSDQGHPLLQVGNNDYIQSPKNYNVPHVPADSRERFRNSSGVGIGQTFTLTQIAPPLHPSRHYKLGERDRVIVKSSGDMPTLRYESFFYAGCNSGRDFIESFQHGVFFYTRKCPLVTYWKDQRDFFDSIIKGKTWAQTKTTLNTSAGDNEMYSFHQF